MNEAQTSTRSRMPRRRVIRLGAAAVILGGLVLNESVTRGYVDDGDGPLAGADVVLADSTRVVARARTDAEGYFRVWHQPFARQASGMLICAPGHVVHHSRQASSAIVRSEYTIGKSDGRFPDTPHSLGWRASAPASCPPEILLRRIP